MSDPGRDTDPVTGIGSVLRFFQERPGETSSPRKTFFFRASSEKEGPPMNESGMFTKPSGALDGEITVCRELKQRLRE
jgi:hypothetical protein